MKRKDILEMIGIYLGSLVLSILLLKYGIAKLDRTAIPPLVVIAFIPIANSSLLGLLIFLNIVTLLLSTFGAILDWVR